MADRQKPGVMLYFQPMQEAVRELNREQRGDLLTAILDYADPDVSQEPAFTDTALRNQWPYLKNLVDKDTFRYERRSSGHSFSQFCRWYFHFRGVKTDLTQGQWEEIGCPSYKQFAGSENDTWRASAPDTGGADGTADTGDTNDTNDTTYYNVDTNPDTSPGTNSHTNADSNSASNSQTETDTTGVSPPAAAGGADRRKTGRREPPSLPLTNALRDWKEYQQEKYRPLSAASEKSLMGLMAVYAERYGAESVDALVQECIANQWKNIRWERLDRDPDQYRMEGGGGDGHHGGSRAENGGNPARTGWSLPTVDLDAEVHD